jgi:hypothetical protein
MGESVPPAEIEIRRVMSFVDERFNNLSVATGELSRQLTSLQQASSSNESTGATQSKIDDLSAKVNGMDAKVDVMYSIITSMAQKMDIGMPSLSAAESSSSVTGQRRPRPDQSNDDARSPQRQRISTHYTLSATVSSVSDLWKEWTCGLEDGLPSVEYMDRTYKTKWRTSSTGNLFLTHVSI